MDYQFPPLMGGFKENAKWSKNAHFSFDKLSTFFKTEYLTKAFFREKKYIFDNFDSKLTIT